MAESYKQLYAELRASEFGCVPPGFHETEDVYELVREEYPELCDDTILCRNVCGTDNSQPEWKHRIRTLQQHLGPKSGTRVKNLSKGWYYAPTEIDIFSVPGERDTFEVGANYNRWELHDVYGGQRYSGFATPTDYSIVFLFTGESGEEYGYEDEFLPDDTFVYTSEGTEGEMEMASGNAAIRHHRRNNDELHLFEDTDYPWVVTYVGEYEYVKHRWTTLDDQDGNEREAVRFWLEPVGGTEVEIAGGSPESLSMEELYEKAKESSPTRSSSSAGSGAGGSGQSYKGSEIIREFALREADWICQGCEKGAPFLDESGNPYLEVHHLHRRSDGGADDPENVVALCPNCHRRVHHGEDGEEFNQRLIEKVQNRTARFD